jgi:hypothetical protein
MEETTLFKCVKCKKHKPRIEYGNSIKNAVTKEGNYKRYIYRHGSCNDCRREYMTKWHAKHSRNDTKAFRIDSKLTAY